MQVQLFDAQEARQVDMVLSTTTVAVLEVEVEVVEQLWVASRACILMNTLVSCSVYNLIQFDTI